MAGFKIHATHKLKRERTIYTTHNGFRFWLKDKTGTIEVSEEYYKKVKKSKL